MESLDQEPLDEVPMAEPRQLRVEMHDEEVVDVDPFQHAHLAAQRRELEGRFLRPEEPARMRLEGENRQRRLAVPGDFPGASDDRLMAQMDAIEIADRDRRSAHRFRQAGNMSENPHGDG